MDSKTLLIVATLVLASTYLSTNKADDNKLTDAFNNFKINHSKQYATAEEELYRFKVHTENMKKIEEHNAKQSSFKMGENKFTDMTEEEFKSLMTGVLPKTADHEEAAQSVFHSEEYVGDVNWVTKGAVQKVKDQGICGSCWAFSSAAVCESADAIFNGHLGDFSEKQLMDCLFTTGGCQGGWPDKSLAYYVDAGFCTEAGYPYNIYIDFCHTSTCTYTKPQFNITGYKSVSSGSTSSLKAACDTQPISICVDSSNWLNYASGIFDQCPSNPGQDHAVLLAGYAADYYLVKNSWGVSWGEEGYIRITSATDNCCGIADTAIYPTV